ncbi:MAG TPA: energy-coupling factor transporter ATPase [Candidatus Aphodomorpha intestinavium]|uniref:Energy-coupling factor transporter ATPase n=1 Tax=Candidatus Aphodomorpha intestinavium TaxID=2840672 RepID=A0A9D1N4B1_9FIRM|nr:energy-coupling factor transporter ATPase [Candidatus Aphodomorpha intestinavium]
MIELRDVSYAYAPEQDGADAPGALHGVSLTVEDGEMLAIVGHNGSGKSTLAKHLNALLLPTAGTVLVDGMDTRDEQNVLEIRRRVGLVFQNPDNQLVTTIVEEDVGFGPENLGLPPEQIRARVAEALETVGMAAHAREATYALSGGQKQRVAIAGMLAMQPEVLVLDEATAMLDPRGRQDVLDVVERLHRERGMTVVMITQYMEEAARCGRVAVMNGGRLVAQGAPREVFGRAEALRAAGLEPPEAVQLREALRQGGMPVDGDPITLEELADAICRSLSNN